MHLTLDLQVQSIAEEEISKAVTEFGAKWGGVLVVDVAAGDVLAWAQFPFFNPNSYNQYRPSEYRNRLAQDALEPGSTFKPFLIASALQEGVVTRDTTFNCENGLWKSRYITIRDDSRPKQNIQSVAKILANSSNIGCGKIGLELGAVKYQRYLSRLASANARASSSPRAAASCARRANGARPTLFPLHSDRAFRSRCSRWRRRT